MGVLLSLHHLRWTVGSLAIVASLIAFGCNNRSTDPNTNTPVTPIQPNPTPNPGTVPPADPNPQVGGGFSVVQGNKMIPYISCNLAKSLLANNTLEPIQEKCLADCTQLTASGVYTLNCEAQCQVPLSRCGLEVERTITRPPAETTEPGYTDYNQPTSPAETYDRGPNDPLFDQPSLCSTSGQDMDRRLCITRGFAHAGRNDDSHIYFQSKYRTLYKIRRARITETFLHFTVSNYPGGEAQRKGFKFYFQGLDGCKDPRRCPGRILRFPAGRQGNLQRYDMKVGVIKNGSSCRLKMQLIDPGSTNSSDIRLELMINTLRC